MCLTIRPSAHHPMISGRSHRDFVTSESVASCDLETEPVIIVFMGFPRQLKHESSQNSKDGVVSLFSARRRGMEKDWRRRLAAGAFDVHVQLILVDWQV